MCSDTFFNEAMKINLLGKAFGTGICGKVSNIPDEKIQLFDTSFYFTDIVVNIFRLIHPRECGKAEYG